MDAKQVAMASEILNSDETVIKSWKRIHDFLEIKSNSVQLQNQFNCGMLTSYELFSSILNLWVTEKGVEATMEKLCSVLTELNFINVSEKLQSKKTDSKPLLFDVFPPINTFVGRTQNIKRLQGYFENPDVSIVKITGLGGIGKSELARKFAENIKNRVNCIWLIGESSESLQHSVHGLAITTRVSTIDNKVPRKVADLFQDVIVTLKNKNQFPILLIIDNVDVRNSDVVQLLSNIRKLRYFAVVTSRHVGVLEFAGEMINLDVLSPDNSKQLIREAIIGETEEDIISLCLLLHYYPLALQQAIAYIKKQKLVSVSGTSYKIQNYLDEYEVKKISMLNFPLNSIEHKYTETTWLTWIISIDQIKEHSKTGTHAVDLINTISYCQADGISIQFLETIFKAVNRSTYLLDPEKTRSTLELLKSYSLIKTEGKTVSIHRLVQEVIRLHCATSNVETNLITRIVDNILSLFVPNVTCSNLELQILSKLCQICHDEILNTLHHEDIIHILLIWYHASKHDEFIKKCSYVPIRIIHLLEDRSKYQEMMQFANLNYNRFKTVLGIEHLDTLKVERLRARAALQNGVYNDALNKYEVVLEKHKRVLGDKHEQTLYTRHEMALTLQFLDRYDEALSQFQTVLELRKTVFGESHKSTMVTKSGIASVLTSQGKLSEAMQIYEEVLVWKIANLGPEHPSTLTARHNIGRSLFEQGEFQKAKEIFQHVTESRIKVLGNGNPNTLATKCMLAQTINELGDKEDALRMLNEVLISKRKVLGRGHPDTLFTTSSIAQIFYNKKEYNKAKELFEENLALFINLYGEEHPNSLNTKSWLAETLYKLSESEQSLKLYQQVLISRKKILGSKHGNTLWTQSQIDKITTKWNLKNES